MTKPIHHQDRDHQALHLASPIDSHMGYSGLGRHDPVQRAERDMTILNPHIDNNGGSLYNLETFCIVHRYEPEEDKQRRENAESGRGYVTDSQIAISQDYSFYTSYWDDGYDDYYDSCYFDGYYDDDYDYDYECDEDDMECSIQMMEEDEDFDEDSTYLMNSVEMGDCLPEENADADWGFDETDPEYEAADAADTEEELEAGTGPSPAIESNIRLSTAFSKATSPEEDLPDVAPETAPRPLPATNNASYQLSA